MSHLINTKILFVIIMLSSISFATTCYQETANVSTTCGGLSTGNYTGANASFIDGNWSSYGDGHMSVSYAIPAGSTNATWVIETADSYSNYTYQNISLNVPSVCMVNGAVNLDLRDCVGKDMCPSGGIHYLAVCHNTTEETVLDRFDWISGFPPNNVRFYEEAIWWDIYLLNSTTSTIVSPVSPIVYGATSNFSCSSNESLYTDLLINGTNKTSEMNVNVIRAAGSYNVTCISYGNSTYAGAQNSTTYTINKAANTVGLLLNNTNNDISVTYLSRVNASASAIFSTPVLYKNGTIVTNNHFEPVSIGVYNYTAISHANENYTADSKTHILTVTDVIDLNVNTLQSSYYYLNTLPLLSFNASFSTQTAVTAYVGSDLVYSTNNYVSGTTTNVNISQYIDLSASDTYVIKVNASNPTTSATHSNTITVDVSFPLDFKYYRLLNGTLNMSGVYNLIILNASNFDYAKIHANGSDIRFFDKNGNILPCYIQMNTSGDSNLFFWSNVSEVMLAYGHDSIDSPSSCTANKPFYDNFNDGIVDSRWLTNVTKTTGGVYTAGATPIFNESNGYLHLYTQVTPDHGDKQNTTFIVTYNYSILNKKVIIEYINMSIYNEYLGTSFANIQNAVLKATETSGNDRRDIYDNFKVYVTAPLTTVYENGSLISSTATIYGNLTLIEGAYAYHNTGTPTATTEMYINAIYEEGAQVLSVMPEHVMHELILFNPINTMEYNGLFGNVVYTYFGTEDTIPAQMIVTESGETVSTTLTRSVSHSDVITDLRDGQLTISVYNTDDTSITDNASIISNLYYIISTSYPAVTTDGQYITYDTIVGHYSNAYIMQVYILNNLTGTTLLTQMNTTNVQTWRTTLYMPTVTAETNITIENYLTLLRNGITTTKTYTNSTIKVRPFGIGLCDANFTKVLFNISAWDEVTDKQFMSSNTFNTEIYAGAVGSINKTRYGFSTNGTVQTICTIDDAIIEFAIFTTATHTESNGSTYTKRSYFTPDTIVSIDSFQIKIYLLNTSISSNIDVVVKDCNGNELVNRIVKFYTYYAATNLYSELFNVKTDINGKAATQVKAYDSWYKIVVINEDNVITNTIDYETISQSPLEIRECNIISISDSITGISYTVTYSGNVTNTVVATIQSSISRTFRLRIDSPSFIGRTNYCNSTSTGYSAILICDMSGMNIQDMQWNIETYETSIYDSYWQTRAFGVFSQNKTNIFGLFGLFLGVLLIGVTAFSFVANARYGIIMTCISFTVARALGLIAISEVATLSLWAVAIIILYVTREA